MLQMLLRLSQEDASEYVSVGIVASMSSPFGHAIRNDAKGL